MPTVKIAGVSFESPQVADTPFPVTVTVDNRETVGPLGTDHDACGSGLTTDGHLVDVTVTVRDGNTVAWEETKRVCAPLDDAFGSWTGGLTGNKDVQFSPAVDEGGTYTVQARVIGLRDGDQPDASSPRTLTVEDDAADLPGDGGSDSNPWDNWTGGGDDGSSPWDNPGGGGGGDLFPDLSLGDQANAVLIILALFAIAWGLDSVEGFGE